LFSARASHLDDEKIYDHPLSPELLQQGPKKMHWPPQKDPEADSQDIATLLRLQNSDFGQTRLQGEIV
jgi:hypothetical protein